MKAAGYIFLAILLAILMYVSVERFTVTITGVDSATPPVVTKMEPIPTSAMSTTAIAAAPAGLTNSAVSLAPPLPAALQPPVPIPSEESATVPPVPDEVLGTVAPPDFDQMRLDELVRREQAAQNEVVEEERRTNEWARAWSALPEGPEKEAAGVTYTDVAGRFSAAQRNLEQIQNQLASLRR
jgi:hypothetical protein